MLRTMNEARPFKLVSSLEVPGPSPYNILRKFVEVLGFEVAKGALDSLNSSPTFRIARAATMAGAAPLSLIRCLLQTSSTATPGLVKL